MGGGTVTDAEEMVLTQTVDPYANEVPRSET
jgi:hypothetical protein